MIEIVLLCVIATLLGVLLFLALNYASGEAKRAREAQARLEAVLSDALERGAESAEERQNRLEMRMRQADDLLRASVDSVRESTLRLVQGLGDTQNRQFEGMTRAFSESFESVSRTVNGQLAALRQGNESKLDAMRAMVEEKLDATLQSRLSSHFSLLSSQLSEVEKGLGEMRSLAGNVDSLTRIMTNVKTRGTMGEVRLGAILSEILAPAQFEENVETVPGSGKRVEFALRMPGAEAGDSVWLPIDSKFPQEDWERLEDARSAGDREAEAASVKALKARFESEAKDISTKYLRAPFTTDFAVMFLPTESLYAELLRIPGLFERLQRDWRVMPAGPVVMAALLNSLQVGFRTLAVQERSAEVWKLLGTVKAEFESFAAAMDAVQRRLAQAEDAVTKVRTRTARMGKSLAEVEASPAVAVPPKAPSAAASAASSVEDPTAAPVATSSETLAERHSEAPAAGLSASPVSGPSAETIAPSPAASSAASSDEAITAPFVAMVSGGFLSGAASAFRPEERAAL